MESRVKFYTGMGRVQKNGLSVLAPYLKDNNDALKALFPDEWEKIGQKNLIGNISDLIRKYSGMNYVGFTVEKYYDMYTNDPDSHFVGKEKETLVKSPNNGRSTKDIEALAEWFYSEIVAHHPVDAKKYQVSVDDCYNNIIYRCILEPYYSKFHVVELTNYLSKKGFEIQNADAYTQSHYGIHLFVQKGDSVIALCVKPISFFGMRNGKIGNDSLMYERIGTYSKLTLAKRKVCNNIYFSIFNRATIFDEPLFLMKDGSKKLLVPIGKSMDKDGNSKISDVLTEYAWNGLKEGNKELPF